VAPHPPPLVGTTLAAYLLLYALLLVSYVAVLKYMAEHPTTPPTTEPHEVLA